MCPGHAGVRWKAHSGGTAEKRVVLTILRFTGYYRRDYGTSVPSDKGYARAGPFINVSALFVFHLELAVVRL
jgi:hypothetical protein